MVNGLWFILGLIEVYLQIWYRYLTLSLDFLCLLSSHPYLLEGGISLRREIALDHGISSYMTTYLD
jgi:hypothetical protein